MANWGMANGEWRMLMLLVFSRLEACILFGNSIIKNSPSAIPSFAISLSAIIPLGILASQ